MKSIPFLYYLFARAKKGHADCSALGALTIKNRNQHFAVQSTGSCFIPFSQSPGYYYIICLFFKLMMEQTQPGERHRYAVFIAFFYHNVVPDGASRLRDIFYAASMRPVNIVPEWEKRV